MENNEIKTFLRPCFVNLKISLNSDDRDISFTKSYKNLSYNMNSNSCKVPDNECEDSKSHKINNVIYQ